MPSLGVQTTGKTPLAMHSFVINTLMADGQDQGPWKVDDKAETVHQLY